MNISEILKGADVHYDAALNIEAATFFEFNCMGRVCSDGDWMTGPVFIYDARYWTLTAGFGDRPSRVFADFPLDQGEAALSALFSLRGDRPAFLETLSAQKQFAATDYVDAISELAEVCFAYEDTWTADEVIENCSDTAGLEFVARHLETRSAKAA